MCVIIQRQPCVTIPYDKIASACVVNPDGWGVAFADRGKLEVHTFLDKETDPDQVMKVLEDAKDLPLMLHLRFTTQGKRIIENCHPFWTLVKEEDGVDLAFCHNGTLWEWKESDSDYSDSYWLNEKVIAPLYQRTAAFVGPENILKDEFSAALLETIAGNTSLFGLIDGHGNQLAINGDKGKKFEGWWASNEYSFNDGHRKKTSSYSTTSSSTTTTTTPREVWPDTSGAVDPWAGWGELDAQNNPLTKVLLYEGGLPYYVYFDKDTGAEVHKELAKAYLDNDTSVPEDTEDEIAKNAQLLDDCDEIKKVFDMHEKKMNPKMIKACTDRKDPTFVEMCKIEDLREVTRLDPDDLEELCSFYPDAAAVLIRDLLYELYFKSLVAQRSISSQQAAENLAARKNEAA